VVNENLLEKLEDEKCSEVLIDKEEVALVL
jgi:hypothetical protein